MLIGVVRVGALRQRVSKAVAVVGPAPKPTANGFTVAPVARHSGLWTVETPLMWLGAADARQAWVDGMSAALAADRANVLPTGVTGRIGGTPFTTPPGEDRHVIEVASVSEQEVLCNLLREHAALLIAVTGRSPSGAGSRRLAVSREHVTTRYLRSAAGTYLARLESSLRRTDGLAGLSHMDIHPGSEPDGTPTVTVRCVDAAASLSTTRAHAVLIAAFALRAQRLVRDGHRVEESSHRAVDDDRARAVARGMSAHLTLGTAGTSARHRLRTLLETTLSVELDNLGATAEELFPVVAAVDLPAAGLRALSTEDALLARRASREPKRFAAEATRALLDTRPGGPCVDEARRAAPGRTGLLLSDWTELIAARRGADVPPARHGTVPRRRGADNGAGRKYRPADRAADRPADRAADRPADRAADRPAQRSGGRR